MEKTIEKVRKLIALGTNEGATEGERDNAIRMAHGLLAKHNLSMADLQEKTEDRIELFSQYRNSPWTAVASNAIAKLFFCFCYVERAGANPKRKTFFIGKESNVTTAILMADYVISSIYKEQTKNKYSISFSNGAANRISQRVTEIINSSTMQDGESTCTDLALVSVYKTELEANKEFVEKSVGKLENAKGRQQNRNASEWFAGQSYGNGISLNNQLNRSSNKNQRLN